MVKCLKNLGYKIGIFKRKHTKTRKRTGNKNGKGGRNENGGKKGNAGGNGKFVKPEQRRVPPTSTKE
jgi:hypothetical protein